MINHIKNISLFNNRSNVFLFLLLALAWIVSFSLGVKNNDSPFYYHFDEPGKVRQIITDERNYRHPTLLIELSYLVTKLTSARDPQEIVQAGRTASAILMASGILCLLTVLIIRYGPFSLLVGIPILIFYDRVIIHSHFFKEDSAMVFGMGGFFLALSIFLSWPNQKKWMILGIGSALAISGKYYGAVLLIIPIIIVLDDIFKNWLNKRSLAPNNFALFLTGFLFIFLLINLRSVLNPVEFIKGLRYEIVHSATGHYGVSRLPFDGFYWRIILDDISIPIAGLSLVFVFQWLFSKEKKPIDSWLVFMSILLYFSIELARIKTGRYFLPFSLMVHYMAALGLCSIIHNSKYSKSIRYTIGIIVIVTISFINLSRSYERINQFKNDSRKQLSAFVLKELPASSIIAQDRFCALPDPDFYASYGSQFSLIKDPLSSWDIRTINTFPDQICSLSEMQKEGITHIAVSMRLIDRQGGQQRPEKRKFYEQLFKHGDLIWEYRPSGRSTHAQFDPPLRLYSIINIDL
jgi:hypothetical protein